MGVFYHEEPPNYSKKCRCLAAILKELVSSSHCQTFGGRLSNASLELDDEDECPMSDFEEEQEVVVSEVRSRAMDKQKHKPNLFRDSFSWVYSPATKELYYVTDQATVPQQQREDSDEEEQNNEREEFLSVKSCFSSCCSSSGEAFYSVKTNFSRSSSLKEVEQYSKYYWRRSIIQELCHCEGWPFGLCRRAVLLPPLPKSPSESWLSRKIQRTTKDT